MSSKPPPLSVCEEANQIIHGQRREDYGTPRASFERIAALWAIVLGVDVTPQQVVLCMIQLKVARALHGWHRDSFVDIAGYAGCAELIENDM